MKWHDTVALDAVHMVVVRMIGLTQLDLVFPASINTIDDTNCLK